MPRASRGRRSVSAGQLAGILGLCLALVGAGVGFFAAAVVRAGGVPQPEHYFGAHSLIGIFAGVMLGGLVGVLGAFAVGGAGR